MSLSFVVAKTSPTNGDCLEKMAEAWPGTSLAKLAWLVAWHIRDESYAKGQIELVNAHHQLPFAAHWGEGSTSSSERVGTGNPPAIESPNTAASPASCSVPTCQTSTRRSIPR